MIRKCVKQMNSLKSQIDKLSKQYDKRRKYLINQYEKSNTFGSMDFEVDDLVAKVSKSVRIDYDVDKLKKKLSKKKFKRIINRSYQPVDGETLIKVLKENNISREIITQCITANYTVDEEKLNDMFDLGEITQEELTGCYSITPTRTTVTIKTVAREANEN